MGSTMSQYTTSLANSFCGGSSRKLIAGWWYSILTVTAIMAILSFWVMTTRSHAEGFVAVWSAILLCVLSVGGTMIMRKFHNSMAVGFFMGGVVAMSQLFFVLFMVYAGYGKQQRHSGQSAKEESFMSFFSILQSLLLGSFAAILGAHRSEILDKNALEPGISADSSDARNSNYVPPKA